MAICESICTALNTIENAYCEFDSFLKALESLSPDETPDIVRAFRYQFDRFASASENMEVILRTDAETSLSPARCNTDLD